MYFFGLKSKFNHLLCSDSHGGEKYYHNLKILSKSLKIARLCTKNILQSEKQKLKH